MHVNVTSPNSHVLVHECREQDLRSCWGDVQAHASDITDSHHAPSLIVELPGGTVMHSPQCTTNISAEVLKTTMTSILCASTPCDHMLTPLP